MTASLAFGTTLNNCTVPGALLLGGIGLIVYGLIYACMGKAYARFHGWVYRENDPKGFWGEVATYCILGAALVAYAIYESYFAN
jgi:hypothetical protein